MRFHSKEDKFLFLNELGRTDDVYSFNESATITEEEEKEFIKKRGTLIKGVRDRDKSSAQKTNWRQNKHKIMKGIKKYHKSSAGKRFHRNMSRFMMTRITRDKTPNSSIYEMGSYLSTLNSLKQTFSVELEFYHPLFEQMEIETILVDYALPIFTSLERKIIENAQIDDDELTFLLDFNESDTFLDEFSKRVNIEFAKVKSVFENITKELYNIGMKEDHADFQLRRLEDLKKAFDT